MGTGRVPRLHLQFVLNVVRQSEELLLSFRLALGIARQQALGPGAAARLANPLGLSPGRARGEKAGRLSITVDMAPRLHRKEKALRGAGGV